LIKVTPTSNINLACALKINKFRVGWCPNEYRRSAEFGKSLDPVKFEPKGDGKHYNIVMHGFVEECHNPGCKIIKVYSDGRVVRASAPW